MTCASALSQLGDQLTQLVASREKPMLDMGDNIQKCAILAYKLRENLKSLYNDFQAGSAAQSPLRKITISVTAALNDLATIQDSLTIRKVSIEKSRSILQQLNSHCEHLEKSSRYFQVLALNMRIQSASIDGGAMLFETMVASTKQLAIDIQSVGQDVLSLIHKTIVKSNNAGQHIHEQLPRISLALQKGHENFLHADQRVNELDQKVGGNVFALQDRSARLSEAISSIVVELQFHDRLRQRFEHISESFEMIPWGTASEVELHEVVPFVLGLSIAQINDEISMIIQTMKNSQSAMQSIQGQILAITEMMEDRHDNSNSNTLDEFLADLLNLITQTESQFNVGVKLDQDAQSNLIEFQESAIQVQEHLKTIMAWKVKSKVLSLNSIILAGQLGEAGVGLAVISQEIVRKSEELASLVESINEVALTISTENSTPVQMDALSNILRAKEYVIKMLEEVKNQKTQAQSTEYAHLHELLNYSNTEIKQLGSFLDSCKKINSRIQDLSGPCFENEAIRTQAVVLKHPCVESIRSKYTMNEERKVFAQYIGEPFIENTSNAESSNEADIELF